VKKGRKISLIALVSIVAIVVVAGLVYVLSPSSSDYGTFLRMRDHQIRALRDRGLTERGISKEFADYSMSLPPLYAFMFKAGQLSLFLRSYTGNRINTATINQLEIGESSGSFFDFTFMIRPEPEYNVPFFHGDALKALPGVTSALYMDFYSLNERVDIEGFFRDRAAQLSEALELARPYWKHEGFGELTPHLDPFKSRWRLEMVEPENASEDEKREYFETVFRCFSLYLDAYLASLDGADVVENSGSMAANRESIRNFVSILYENDVAVKMGKMIFPEEDFDSYFLDGFWGVAD
jgi:hypothetical protein